MKDISRCVSCAIICMCFGLMVSIISLAILGTYFDRYGNIKIQIINVEYTSNNTKIFTLNPLEILYCVSLISKTNTCDNYIKCPNDLSNGLIYDYYCDCRTKLCSFNKQYDYHEGAPFYLSIGGISFCAIIIMCLFIRYFIKKNIKKENIRNENIQLDAIVYANN